MTEPKKPKPKRRPDYQLLADGSAKAEILHPVSGERKTIYGTPLEVMARKADTKKLRQEIATGMVTPEQIQLRMVRIGGVVSELQVPAVMARYLDRLEAEGRARGEAGDSPTVEKARGLSAKHILPRDRLGAVSVTELTFDAMTDWYGKLARAEGAGGEYDPKGERQRLKDKSISTVFTHIKTAVRGLIRANRLHGYPWGEFTVRVSKSARTVGRGRAKLRGGAELARLLAAAETQDAAAEKRNAHAAGKLAELPDLRNRLVVMIGLALRRGEAAGLAWDCVRERPDGSWQVEIKFQAREQWAKGLSAAEHALARPQAPCKSSSAGTTQFSKRHLVADTLRKQKELLEFLGLYRAQGPVFPTPDGLFRKRDVIACKTMRRLGKLAGIVTLGRFVQHSTRHSAATLMLDAGASIREAMLVTRHSNLSTFGGYIEEVGRNNVRLPENFIGMLGDGEASEPAPVDAPIFEPRQLPLAIEKPTEEEAATVARGRGLARRAADFAGEAFREWLAMGQPYPKRGNQPTVATLPPTVVAAAEEARERAREAARYETATARKTAGARAYANTVNAWEPQRRRSLARLLNEGKLDGLELSTLAEVAGWSADERKRAGLATLSAAVLARLPGAR